MLILNQANREKEILMWYLPKQCSDSEVMESLVELTKWGEFNFWKIMWNLSKKFKWRYNLGKLNWMIKKILKSK